MPSLASAAMATRNASQVFYTEPTEPDLVVVSVGAFADPSFPPPTESGHDSRRRPWVGPPDSIERHAPELWDPVRPKHLGLAIEMWVGLREMAKEDSDFDPIRGEPEFARLVER